MVKSYASKVDGAWLGEQAAALNLRHTFETNRDPLMARQREDTQKSEAQRRRDLAGEKSPANQGERKIDKPAPALKPPTYMRPSVQSPQSPKLAPGLSPASTEGLIAQRDAAFAQAAKQSARASPDLTPSQSANLTHDYNAHSHTPSQLL